MATIACAFCKSKGKDPFRLLSRFSTCEVCNGKGSVTQKGNKEGFIRKGVEAYGKYSG